MNDEQASRRLSVTVAHVRLPIRDAIERVAELGIGALQLDAAAPGLRPAEMDQSARRDLLALLRRRELGLSGVDLWIPADHFLDPAHVDRAMAAAERAIAFAADLGRVPLCLTLPRPDQGEDDAASTIALELESIAQRAGPLLIDFSVPLSDRGGPLLAGIDPPACLSDGVDPIEEILNRGDRIGQVRMADLSRTGARVPPGTADGQLDLIAFRTAISVAPAKTPPVIDTRGWQNPWSGIRLTLDQWS